MKRQPFAIKSEPKLIIAKQAAEATFEAEVACEAVFGRSARESCYCDDFFNFENLLPLCHNLSGTLTPSVVAGHRVSIC